MGVDLATNSHGLRDYEYRYERTPDTLLVANFPELHDVQHYRLQEITDLMKQAADEDGVAFIDLRDSVKNQDSSKLWVTRPDPHPNSLANKFYADALYQKLRTLQYAHVRVRQDAAAREEIGKSPLDVGFWHFPDLWKCPT